MNIYPEVRLSVWGGLIGLLVPLFLTAVYFLLAASKIALGEHLATGFPIIALALLELPVVSIGRTCGLSIETAGIVFIPFNLNGFGYTLLTMFWTGVGLLIGGGIGGLKRFSRRGL